jgi:hypothetical protein
MLPFVIRDRPHDHGHTVVGAVVLRPEKAGAGVNERTLKFRRCAVYTRKSSEEGLEQEFNSLHAQREHARLSSKASKARAGSW